MAVIRKKHNLCQKNEKYYTDYAHELKLPHLKKLKNNKKN